MRRPRGFLLEAPAGETMDDDADAWMNTSFGVEKGESRDNDRPFTQHQPSAGW